MEKAPKIGTCVRYTGDSPWGRGGIVREIWPYYPDSPFVAAPERDWSVSVEVDEVPDDWPYTGTKIFTPFVSQIEPT